VLAGLLTVAALATSTVFMWQRARGVAETAAYRNASQAALSVAREQERLIETALQLAVGLAQRREVQARDADRCHILFESVLRAFPMYLDLLATRPSTGEVFCAGRSPASINLVNPADVRRAVESGNTTLGQLTLDTASRRASLTLTAPAVDDAGSVQAVVVLALDLTRLTRTMVETPLAEGATFFIVERSGMVLAHHPEPELWVGEILAEPLRDLLVGGWAGTAEGTGLDGRTSLFAVAPLLRDVARLGDASVVVAIPRQAILHDSQRLLSAHVVGLGILALLMLVTAGVTADRLVMRPIAAMTAALRRLMAGDRTARPPATSRGGLVRPLALAVERLARKIEAQWSESAHLEKMLARAEAPPASATAPTRREPAPAVAPAPPERSRPPAAPTAVSLSASEARVEPSAPTSLEAYWEVTEAPFGSSSDPRFLFLAPNNEDALLQLTYAVHQRRGCALLTGEPGCGKTTLVRALLARLDSKSYQVVVLNSPSGTPTDLLRDILRQLGMPTQDRRRADLVPLLNDALERNFWRRRDTVIVADDTHLVQEDRWLEQIGLLLSPRSDSRSAVTIVMVGAPQLTEKVREVKILDQRVAVRCHLTPLDEAFTARYVAHRLAVVGRVAPIFTAEALKLVFAVTRGTPREINNLCDSALMRGFVARAPEIDETMVRAVASLSEAQP
jgi:general secretion pathway protein A